MTGIAVPYFPGFKAIHWQLERNVSVAESPLSRTVQRIVRTGDRWRCTLVTPPLQNDDAAVLKAFLSQAARGDTWFYLSPPQNMKRGSFLPAEYLLNTDFSSGTASWAADTNIAVNANNRSMRILVTGGAPNSNGAIQNVTLAGGDVNSPFALIADLPNASLANSPALELRNQSGGGLIAGGNFAAGDRAVLVATPTVAGVYYRLALNAEALNKFAYLKNPSLTRILQVNGGSQTGSQLNIKAAPVSANAFLKAGQYLTVKSGSKWQMVELVQDADSFSDGTATLFFEPTLRVSPSDSDPIIVTNPFVRMFISKHSHDHDITAPNFYGFQIDAQEDITP